MTIEEHIEKTLREMGIDFDDVPLGDPSEFLAPMWEEDIDEDDDDMPPVA